MNSLDDTWNDLVELLDGIDGTRVVTEGRWQPPCIVLGHSGWTQIGASWWPQIIATVVLDSDVTDKYALSLIKQQDAVLAALFGQSYIFRVTPEGPRTSVANERQYLTATIRFGIKYGA